MRDGGAGGGVGISGDAGSSKERCVAGAET
jgi:hypothetical protein